MQVNVKALVAGVVFGITVAVVAWAITTDQIWQNVYNSTNQSIRIRQVP